METKHIIPEKYSDYKRKQFSRRDLIRAIPAVAAGAVISGCISQERPSILTPAAPSTAISSQDKSGDDIYSAISSENINTYSQFMERLKSFRNLDYLNPPLYKDSSPHDAFEDVKSRRIIDLPDRIIAQLYYLLRCPAFDKNLTNPKEFHTRLQLIDTVYTAADLFTLVTNDRNGRDNDNKSVMGYLEPRIWEILHVFGNSRDIIYPQHDHLTRLKEDFNTMRALYVTPEPESYDRYQDAIRKINSLISTKKIDLDDPVLFFVQKVNKFDNPKGLASQAMLAEKILDRAMQSPDQNLSVNQLFDKMPNNDLFINLLPQISANSAHFSAWNKADWDLLSVSKTTGNFKSAFLKLWRKKTVWQDYLPPQTSSSHEVLSRNANGITIYGETKPCDDSDLQAIFLKTAGNLFDKVNIPPMSQVAEYRKRIFNPDERKIEFILSESAYQAVKSYLPANINFETWLQLHIDKINEMMSISQPKVNMNVTIPRIMIVKEGLIEQRRKYYSQALKLPYKDTLVINSEDNSLLYQKDYLSPWSVDVQNRWIFDKPPLSVTAYKTDVKLPTGQTTTIDHGMIHEVAHGIFLMADNYWSNTETIQPEQLKRMSDTAVREGGTPVPESLMIMYFRGGYGGDILPIINGGDLGKGEKFFDYGWVESMHFLFMQKKHTDFSKTQYWPYYKSPQFHTQYELLQNKIVSFESSTSDGRQIKSLKVIPYIDKNIIGSEKTGQNKFKIDPRDLYSNVFHPEHNSGTLLMQFNTTDGSSCYLPFPAYFFKASYCAAILENKQNMDFKINFLQPANKSFNPYKLLNLYIAPEDKLKEARDTIRGELYATMHIEFEGKKYYALWEMLPK